VQAWDELSKDYIVKTCKAFRPWIEAVLAANGKHIELNLQPTVILINRIFTFYVSIHLRDIYELFSLFI
jgi:hypothetical protein